MSTQIITLFKIKTSCQFFDRILITCFYRTRQVRKSVKEVDPERGVTIVFHILLDSNFNIPGEASLHIRANGVDIGHWDVNCVDLKLIE